MPAKPSDTADHLLHVLSARGRLPLAEFNAAFDLLAGGVLEDRRFRYAHRQVARHFDGLGHAEFDYDRRQVLVCPPALVRLPSHGLPRAVLAGARDARQLNSLRTWLGQQPAGRFDCLESSPTQPELCLPNVLVVETLTEADLEELAHAQRLQFQPGAPAAWRLLHFSTALSKVMAGADFRVRENLNWPARIFLPARGHFVPAATLAPSTWPATRLVEYTHPRTREQRHWVWRPDGTAANLDRDWGRYAALAAAGANVLQYDGRQQLLAVPDTVPLPTLLARALTLCAGVAPPAVEVVAGPGRSPQFLAVYQGITPAIAQGVATKLQQVLLPSSLHPLLPS